ARLSLARPNGWAAASRHLIEPPTNNTRWETHLMTPESNVRLNANDLMGCEYDREKWLTTNYVGKCEQARPWFASAEFETGYSGPVPIEAVEKLFEWQAIEGPVITYLPCDMHEADVMGDDGLPMRKVTDPSRKAIIRSDTGDVLNVVSAQYG